MTTMSSINQFNTYTNSIAKNDKTNKTGLSGQGSIGSNAMTNSLTITDFYKLLATQLQYQDADNPMDTGEMMNQLVQTQMSQTISYMTTAISDMSTVNLITYASSMIGKEVTVAEVDEDGNITDERTTGVVSGVSLDGMPYIYIDGKKYSVMQIMTMGEVPKEPEEPENPDNTQEKIRI